MNCWKLCVLGTLCVAVAVLVAPSVCSAQCYSCAMPVVAAPTYVGYAPMPSVIYRAAYRPAVAAYTPAYQPVTGYAVTTYHPTYRNYRAAYRAGYVPYAAYMPVYAAAPVVTAPACSTCNYATYYAPSYDSCSACSTCSTGSCGVVSSGCSSCAAPATVVSPSPYGNGSEASPSTNAAPPKTFQDKVEKPVTEPSMKPIPQTETRPSSMSSPLLPDPQNRTAARAVYTSAGATMVSATKPVEDEDGWRPARD